jgi:hypothetical protein
LKMISFFKVILQLLTSLNARLQLRSRYLAT